MKFDSEAELDCQSFDPSALFARFLACRLDNPQLGHVVGEQLQRGRTSQQRLPQFGRIGDRQERLGQAVEGRRPLVPTAITGPRRARTSSMLLKVFAFKGDARGAEDAGSLGTSARSGRD